jgi:hypothetical protein
MDKFRKPSISVCQNNFLCWKNDCNFLLGYERGDLVDMEKGGNFDSKAGTQADCSKFDQER